MQPAPSLIASTVEDLRRHAPFDAMERATLQYLAGHLSLVYFATGEMLLSPDDGVAMHMYIVQKGRIHGVESNADSTGDSALTLSEGECFPIGALISQRASVLTFVAAQDSFCYQLALADFEHVMDVSRPFRDFATLRLANLLAQSRHRIQGQYMSRVSAMQSLASPLKSIVRRKPVTVTPDTPIRDVLKQMKTLRIGSVVVVATDAPGQPVGIFTERDV
ncbi:MAG: CBS domain-containing protein, partial [Burkholderiales bacterium]|nr:CBS domain-containing protein [Burkholderiales bacterium]